jgi:hypothetical protein
VAETAEGVTVYTGRMTMQISKKNPFGMIDRVEVGGRRVVDGGVVSYVQLHGRAAWNDPSPWQQREFTAAPPDTVRVWYQGPLRVTIEVSGPFAEDPLKARYYAWLTTWAGRTDVHVKYALCNSNSGQYTALPVHRSSVRLRLSSETATVMLGAGRPVTTTGDGWLYQGLRLAEGARNLPGAASAGSGENIIWNGGRAGRAAGWIAAIGGESVLACDRLFASNPSRRLSVKDGFLVLEGIAPRAEAAQGERPDSGLPWLSEGFWLYDCSHHTSEYLLDFAPPRSAEGLEARARAGRNRLWAIAPPEHYSNCEALGVGHFGSLADEIACYQEWGWPSDPATLPHRSDPLPEEFVGFEDNHYVSESDSVEALLLMYLRTGQRGWFDLAEAWARYHADLQSWRTDGWRWKDGAIWFPSGGPQGTPRIREDWNFGWGPSWAERKSSPDCIDLWRHARAKSCYCHFYGSGLVDYYCLTGDRDAWMAALDNVEQKNSEFRDYHKFAPGTTSVASIRGFGRGFQVMMRALKADPTNDFIADLCHLCARTLWESPLLDERGFHCSHIGGGFGGMSVKSLTPRTREWMLEQGITFTTVGDTIDSLRKGDREWKVHCMGGTWQHVYVQNGAEMYASHFDDEDMRDFVIAFAQLSARHMMSEKCHQTWYLAYFDIPDFGLTYDPWKFEHTDTSDGEGCVHEGGYTVFYPTACALGYSFTGENDLLGAGKRFWYYGGRRGYRTEQLRASQSFAGHRPPKDDTILSTARLFYEAAHERVDVRPPTRISDLRVRALGGDRFEVRFMVPDDPGGRVVCYQVKAAELPIVPYEQWDPTRDPERTRNWWRALNCAGEPDPGAPGKQECFVVTGPGGDGSLYFAVRSFDDSGNRSEISNLVKVPLSDGTPR